MAAVLARSDSEDAWPEVIQTIPGTDEDEAGAWSVSFEMEPRPWGTYIVADPLESVRTGFDRAPRSGATTAELPATSFRGTLRSTAERVLRTLDGTVACDPTDRESSCAARERKARQAQQSFDRCLACRVFGNEEWASWLHIEVVATGEACRGVPLDYVAIDRFTGGAREGRKFDSLSASGGRFTV